MFDPSYHQGILRCHDRLHERAMEKRYLDCYQGRAGSYAGVTTVKSKRLGNMGYVPMKLGASHRRTEGNPTGEQGKKKKDVKALFMWQIGPLRKEMSCKKYGATATTECFFEKTWSVGGQVIEDHAFLSWTGCYDNLTVHFNTAKHSIVFTQLKFEQRYITRGEKAPVSQARKLGSKSWRRRSLHCECRNLLLSGNLMDRSQARTKFGSSQHFFGTSRNGRNQQGIVQYGRRNRFLQLTAGLSLTHRMAFGIAGYASKYQELVHCLRRNLFFLWLESSFHLKIIRQCWYRMKIHKIKAVLSTAVRMFAEKTATRIKKVCYYLNHFRKLLLWPWTPCLRHLSRYLSRETFKENESGGEEEEEASEKGKLKEEGRRPERFEVGRHDYTSNHWGCSNHPCPVTNTTGSFFLFLFLCFCFFMCNAPALHLWRVDTNLLLQKAYR